MSLKIDSLKVAQGYVAQLIASTGSAYMVFKVLREDGATFLSGQEEIKVRSNAGPGLSYFEINLAKVAQQNSRQFNPAEKYTLHALVTNNGATDQSDWKQIEIAPQVLNPVVIPAAAQPAPPIIAAAPVNATLLQNNPRSIPIDYGRPGGGAKYSLFWPRIGGAVDYLVTVNRHTRQGKKVYGTPKRITGTSIDLVDVLDAHIDFHNELTADVSARAPGDITIAEGEKTIKPLIERRKEQLAREHMRQQQGAAPAATAPARASHQPPKPKVVIRCGNEVAMWNAIPNAHNYEVKASYEHKGAEVPIYSKLQAKRKLELKDIPIDKVPPGKELTLTVAALTDQTEQIGDEGRENISFLLKEPPAPATTATAATPTATATPATPATSATPTTAPATPPKPQKLTVRSTGHKKLGWNEVEGAHHYEGGVTTTFAGGGCDYIVGSVFNQTLRSYDLTTVRFADVEPGQRATFIVWPCNEKSDPIGEAATYDVSHYAPKAKPPTPPDTTPAAPPAIPGVAPAVPGKKASSTAEAAALTATAIAESEAEEKKRAPRRGNLILAAAFIVLLLFALKFSPRQPTPQTAQAPQPSPQTGVTDTPAPAPIVHDPDQARPQFATARGSDLLASAAPVVPPFTRRELHPRYEDGQPNAMGGRTLSVLIEPNTELSIYPSTPNKVDIQANPSEYTCPTLNAGSLTLPTGPMPTVNVHVITSKPNIGHSIQVDINMLPNGWTPPVAVQVQPPVYQPQVQPCPPARPWMNCPPAFTPMM